MTETPDAVQAGVDAVMTKEWQPDAPWSVHSKHRYDSGCAVCREDVPAVVATAVEAAGPVLAEHRRRETAQALRAVAETREVLRRFVDRHPMLHEGVTVSAVLLAVADEIEGEARDPR